MKHIKTFEQFVNESSVNEINRRLLGKKPNWPFFFQIHPRDKKSIESGEDKHKVTVKKGENVNDVEKEVLKQYPRNKYYYTLWKNVRGGFKNIGTNESEDLTEEFLNELIEESKITSYIIKNGFTFETVDGKKFTLPRGAEIEAEKITSPRTRNGLQSISFKVVKGKLDGHAADKNKTYEVDINDFNDYINDNDIELNESVNEAKTEGGEEGKVIIEKEFKIDGELVYTIVGLCVKRKTGFTGYVNLVKRGTRPAGTSGFAPFASDYENVINIWKSKKPKDEKECESELKSVIKSIKIS